MCGDLVVGLVIVELVEADEAHLSILQHWGHLKHIPRVLAIIYVVVHVCYGLQAALHTCSVAAHYEE